MRRKTPPWGGSGAAGGTGVVRRVAIGWIHFPTGRIQREGDHRFAVTEVEQAITRAQLEERALPAIKTHTR